jgi:hypothetical protein
VQGSTWVATRDGLVDGTKHPGFRGAVRQSRLRDNVADRNTEFVPAHVLGSDVDEALCVGTRDPDPSLPGMTSCARKR